MNFKKWEDVREVFIAKKKNRSGRKYGFVRFKGVEEVGMLECQLDNMVSILRKLVPVTKLCFNILQKLFCIIT